MSHVLISAAVIIGLGTSLFIALCLGHRAVRDKHVKQVIYTNFGTKTSFSARDLAKQTHRTNREVRSFLKRHKNDFIKVGENRYLALNCGRNYYISQMANHGGYTSHPLIA